MEPEPTPRATRRAGRAIAIAMALVLVLSGCSLFDDDGPRVLVVGDSVTVLSKEELRDQLGWAGDVDVRAQVRLRTDQLLDMAQEGADEDPDIGIFLPGYNDLLQGGADTKALNQMIDIAAGIPCSIWLLIPVDGGYPRDQVDTWNRRVIELAAKHPNIHVTDGWKKLVEETPAFTFISNVDAVHPNQQGRTALAKVMAGVANDQCR